MRRSSWIALSKFPGWPSAAGKEVLRLKDAIDGVKSRLGLQNLVTLTGDESDGLGPYEGLVLKDADVGIVALVTHTRAPYRGTDVIVDGSTSVDHAIDRLKRVLGLGDKDVAWVHPDSSVQFGGSPSSVKPGARPKVLAGAPTRKRGTIRRGAKKASAV